MSNKRIYALPVLLGLVTTVLVGVLVKELLIDNKRDAPTLQVLLVGIALSSVGTAFAWKHAKDIIKMREWKGFYQKKTGSDVIL